MSKWIPVLLIALLLGGFYLSRLKPLAPTDQTPPVISEDSEVSRPIEIKFSPESVIQGEPVLIAVENLSGTTTVQAINFNGKNLAVFDLDGELSALLGLDLRMTTGTYPVTVTLSNGETLKKDFKVGKRVIVEAPLGIPDSLGGNTPQAEQELINTLVQEGAIINAIPVSATKLWNGSFELPLKGEIVITDTYGYSRLTGASTIAHKGTDFRATPGTPVYAMNAGKVAYVGNLRNYGHVIAIDHGTGVLTIYMHLNEVVAKKEESVEKGKLIAKSGATGYVLGPHLHLTVRINGISIDPLKFMALLGE